MLLWSTTKRIDESSGLGNRSLDWTVLDAVLGVEIRVAKRVLAHPDNRSRRMADLIVGLGGDMQCTRISSLADLSSLLEIIGTTVVRLKRLMRLAAVIWHVSGGLKRFFGFPGQGFTLCTS